MSDDFETPEEGVAPILYTFANRSPAPELESLLSMFYYSAFDNTLGIMQALNSETGEEEVLLVGVNVDDNGKTECFPLARLLSAEEVEKYRAPDGEGGFYDLTDSEAAQAVRDSMKPVDESLIDVPLH